MVCRYLFLRGSKNPRGRSCRCLPFNRSPVRPGCPSPGSAFPACTRRGHLKLPSPNRHKTTEEVVIRFPAAVAAQVPWYADAAQYTICEQQSLKKIPGLEPGRRQRYPSSRRVRSPAGRLLRSPDRPLNPQAKYPLAAPVNALKCRVF